MSFSAVVLAAGRGTRMRSARPKVLHPVAGSPMVAHVLDAVASAADDLGAAPVDIAIVVGHRAADVRTAVERHVRAREDGQDSTQDSSQESPPDEEPAEPPGRRGPPGDQHHVRAARFRPAFPEQLAQLGTGHAALQARADLAGRAPAVLVVCGDTPLITGGSIAHLLRRHAESGATLSFITARVEEPAGYGRVLRDRDGRVVRIVEDKHANEAERAIDEINTGVYAVSDAWLWDALGELDATPGGEIYLTDLVAAAAADGRVEAVEAADATEFLGVDTRLRLAQAERVVRDRIRARHMEAGVTMIDPASTWIDAEVRIGRDTELWPGTYLLGGTSVGEACRIGPGAVLRDTRLDDGAEVEHSVLEGAHVGARCHVGPFSHLRHGAVIEAGGHVGNFAELKNARLGAGARMGHFGYVGDADIGEGANIGAGTVTCNYDGHAKHRTTVGRDAFIGSDTMLVAPLTIGDGARTGAGSVVTRDVAPGTTVAGVPARPIPSGRTEGEDPRSPSDDSGEKKIDLSGDGGTR